MPFIEKDDVEMSYRRGYEHGAIETFHAVERFLDPAMREVVRCPCRKLGPHILMMQSAQDGAAEYAANGLDSAGDRRILVQG